MMHPVTGHPELVWARTGDIHVASVKQQARYKRGAGYEVLKPFATVRPMINGSGLFTQDYDVALWVVTRNSFDDLSEHPTLEAAKLHVAALFALEQ